MDPSTAKRLAVVFVALFVLKVCALTMFGRFAVREYRESGRDGQRLRAAVSIELQEFGNVLMFGWAALYFYLVSKGQDVSLVIRIPVATTGGVIAAIGLLYKINVFAPVHWGRASWILSATLTTIAALAVIAL